MKYYDEKAMRDAFRASGIHSDTSTVLDHLRFCIRHLGAGKAKSMDDRVLDDEMSLSFEELIGALLDAEHTIDLLTREPDYPEEIEAGDHQATKVGKGWMFPNTWDWDWCHLCGKRRQTWELKYPNNAEHDQPLRENEMGGCRVRVCRECVIQMVGATMGSIGE
jgi:hypothetical protein